MSEPPNAPVETWEITLYEQLKLVLPMAKGYASEHRVGANQLICTDTDDILRAFERHLSSDDQDDECMRVKTWGLP